MSERPPTDNVDAPLHRWSDAYLRRAAQGCSELTCIYHGTVVAEIRRRARVLPPASTEGGAQ